METRCRCSFFALLRECRATRDVLENPPPQKPRRHVRFAEFQIAPARTTHRVCPLEPLYRLVTVGQLHNAELGRLNQNAQTIRHTALPGFPFVRRSQSHPARTCPACGDSPGHKTRSSHATI